MYFSLNLPKLLDAVSVQSLPFLYDFVLPIQLALLYLFKNLNLKFFLFFYPYLVQIFSLHA
uniref:Candidate secreted effector n=1 Tax=Meloidogyne incognita TaxID=6306 RepID=A0A914KQ64_MELIC